MRMTFRTNISNIFRGVVCVTLAFEIGYLLQPALREPDRLWEAILKIAVCFTCLIGYINDKEKMLVISDKGLFAERMILDERTLPEKLSFVYIAVALLYNPIINPFYSSTYWIVTHVLTIGFFGYKLWYYKKQFGSN